MPLGQYQGIPELIPEEGSPPVLTSPNPLSTSAAVRLRSPLSTVACRNLVPAFPQRSPAVTEPTTERRTDLRDMPHRRQAIEPCHQCGQEAHRYSTRRQSAIKYLAVAYLAQHIPL